MITFTGPIPSDFNITCSNGPNSKTVSAGLVSDVEDSSVRHDNSDSISGMGIVLDYITSSETIVRRNTSTHIFMCGANYNMQDLRINNGHPVAFSASRDLGFHRRVDLDNRHSINGLGIVIARSQFMITTLLVVVDNSNSNIEVTCSHRNIWTRLYVKVESTNPVTNSEVNTEIVSSNTNGKEITQKTIISVLGSLVTAFIISIVSVLAILFFLKKK